jgi:hypothetical protein
MWLCCDRLLDGDSNKLLHADGDVDQLIDILINRYGFAVSWCVRAWASVCGDTLVRGRCGGIKAAIVSVLCSYLDGNVHLKPYVNVLSDQYCHIHVQCNLHVVRHVDPDGDLLVLVNQLHDVRDALACPH